MDAVTMRARARQVTQSTWAPSLAVGTLVLLGTGAAIYFAYLQNKKTAQPVGTGETTLPPQPVETPKPDGGDTSQGMGVVTILIIVGSVLALLVIIFAVVYYLRRGPREGGEAGGELDDSPARPSRMTRMRDRLAGVSIAGFRPFKRRPRPASASTREPTKFGKLGPKGDYSLSQIVHPKEKKRLDPRLFEILHSGESFNERVNLAILGVREQARWGNDSPYEVVVDFVRKHYDDEAMGPEETQEDKEEYIAELERTLRDTVLSGHEYYVESELRQLAKRYEADSDFEQFRKEDLEQLRYHLAHTLGYEHVTVEDLNAILNEIQAEVREAPKEVEEEEDKVVPEALGMDLSKAEKEKVAVWLARNMATFGKKADMPPGEYQRVRRPKEGQWFLEGQDPAPSHPKYHQDAPGYQPHR